MDNMTTVFLSMHPMCIYRARDLSNNIGMNINEVRRNLRRLINGLVIEVIKKDGRGRNILYQTKQDVLFK